MDHEARYKDFGTLFAKLRQEAGFSQQSELAKLIKTTQQTVSRWESGLSRPRDKQIPLIAAALKADSYELMAAAGYLPKMIVTPFDQPFPVDALKPDSFERFCHHFLAKLHPLANVHRAGDSGHTQEGLDVDVTFPDKTTYSFQCKRVQQFGPKDVHTAVAKHTKEADKKFLLISRVASPQSRDAIRKHPTWDIWDKEDISREIRQNLSNDDQVKLVDIFFPGQRLALLGEMEAGPWQTTKDFFEPFMDERSAFNHKWKLIGRSHETQDTVAALSDPKKRAILLVGAGGSGKSRVLKEAIETYQIAHNSVLVRFLSPRKEITEKSLEDLGKREKVLVVDDAHDESNLQLLFQYAATSSNKAKLLLAFRPYGLDYIKAQASCFSLCGEHIAEIELNPFTIKQATELASLVLGEMNGPEIAAKDIARLTLDCPLATVIGAQIVAKEKINHLEFAKNEELFRATIFGKFQNIITGNIGSKGDDGQIEKLLKVLALIQPFHPEDKAIAAIMEQVEGIPTHEVNRLILLLANAGVLFKRGGNFRLSPDLLADFIIEKACIGHNDTSTGYAEAVFDKAGEAHVKNILLNLGKLDWRRTNGCPSNSKLLDGIWKRLKPSYQYSDPHIDAVTSVAYYQPAKALSFVEQLLREGRYLAELPNILKHIAYNFEHLHGVCELLWEIGKDDHRELSQHPGHAIRVLAEMCAAERNKPFGYNEVVVEFALNLIKDDASWNHLYTPFDILKSILKTEGDFTESHGINFTISWFPVDYSFIAPLKEKVIKAALKLLSSPKTRIAVLAARFLADGVRYYSRSGDKKHHEDWEKAYVKTLKGIEKVMQTETLDSLVQIEIAHSVSWHANNADNDTTTPIAKRIIKSLPDSLEFRTTLALIDGWINLHESGDIKLDNREWDTHISTLANDLLAAYPEGEQLRTFIESILTHIELNFAAGSISAYILYGYLTQSSLSFADATVNNALSNPASKTIQFADIALTELLIENHVKALDIAARFLDTNNPALHAAVGGAYSGLNPTQMRNGEKDLSLLKTVLASKDEWVSKRAVQAIRIVAKNDLRLAIELLKYVDIGMSGNIAEDVFMFFYGDKMIPFRMLTEDDIDYFLTKLMLLPKLNKYWIETFLSKTSKYHTKRTAAFFMKRVEHAAKTQDWHYRPCNYGPYCHVPLRFRESQEFGPLLRQVAQWMKSSTEDNLFQHRAAELFDAMFQPFDNELIGFLQNWIDMATPGDLQVISQILKKASPNVVLEHRPFIIRFLGKAQQQSKERLDDVVSALIGSAISGLRSGKSGEPFPQDIKMKEDAEKALKEIPRFSPAYRLYEYLKKHAEQNIERSRREREQYEE
ncbi:MAG: helix-turn-helix domain-containing protein [Proteobacteria bacterium]|nr:helix-turn-helix domain-containing protein [Pseudomonadota bacterium]MBU4297071.1 helix-turn-helix domain-containing protein [Pseudomonadota bacterium]MCG2749952.1 helix-turn-helix domain-containing protein [Desulfobulbaceae bacterium]